MQKRYSITGLLLLAVGAILAFTLEGEHSIQGFIRVKPLGLVLLGFGALLLVCGLVQWRFSRSRSQTTTAVSTASNQAEAIRSIGGLVAVAIGVGAVAALAIVIVTTVGGLEKTAVVSIATSAFGVISTVVGAYMGIKIGTDQTEQAVGGATAAAAAVGAATASLPQDIREKVNQDVANAQQTVAGNPAT